MLLSLTHFPPQLFFIFGHLCIMLLLLFLLIPFFHHFLVLTSTIYSYFVPYCFFLFCSFAPQQAMEEEIASMETNLHEELHRSSSSSPLCVKEKEANVTGNINNNIFSHEISLSMFSDAQYCYSILEAMPLPGPTWSTTAPCVLAEPQSSTHIEGSLEELEWGENQASSYTWWLGFLESLDDNMSTCEKLDHPFIDKNVEIQDSKLLSFDSSFVDAIDLTSSPDDWLMIPPMEMDLGDMVIP